MTESTGSPRPPPERRESGRALPKLILAAALLTLGIVLLILLPALGLLAMQLTNSREGARKHPEPAGEA